MMTSKNSMLAFTLGAAMGGAIALLLAPDKGEVTRQRIRDGGARIVRKGAAVVEHAKTSVEDAGQAIGQATRQRAGAVSEAIAAAKETYVRENTRV